MSNVLQFGAQTPHGSGPARCLACKHEWVGAAPQGTDWLECPACTLHKGRFIYSHVPASGELWACACENHLFIITRLGVICPNCGSYQRFPV